MRDIEDLQRERRLAYLARKADRLAAAELRRVDRMWVVAKTEEEIAKAARWALKRSSLGSRQGGSQHFRSVRHWGGNKTSERHVYVRRADVVRLVDEGRLVWGNRCKSFAMPAPR